MDESSANGAPDRGKVRRVGTSVWHWLGRGFVFGILTMLALNALSYFYYSRSITDLVGMNERVDEAMGFPYVFWTQTGFGEDAFNQSSEAKSNLMFNIYAAVGIGVLFGIFAMLFSKPLNRSVQIFEDQEQSRNRRPSTFQFSVGSLLILMTVAAMVIGLIQWSDIERKPVESSNINSIGYSPLTETLEIEFSSGRVYQYHDVPAAIFHDLMSADSHGSYFSEYVRQARYAFRQDETSPVNEYLLSIFVAGPLCLIVLTMTPGGLSWQTRSVMIGVLTIGVILLAFFVPRTINMPLERVALGLFVFWLPQCVFGAAIAGAWWIIKSGFFSRSAVSK